MERIERETERDKEADRARDTERERKRDRETETDTERARQPDRDRERKREKERVRERLKKGLGRDAQLARVVFPTWNAIHARSHHDIWIYTKHTGSSQRTNPAYEKMYIACSMQSVVNPYRCQR